jgi:hypothetical protein
MKTRHIVISCYALVITSILAVILLFASFDQKPSSKPPIETVFIIGEEMIDTDDGRKMYLLNYAIGGNYYQPYFYSEEKMILFLAYLSKVGGE